MTGVEACGANGVVLVRGADGKATDAVDLGTLPAPNVDGGLVDPKTLGASLTVAKGDVDEAYAMKPACGEVC